MTTVYPRGKILWCFVLSSDGGGEEECFVPVVPAQPEPVEVKWRDGPDCAKADCGEMVLVVWPDDMHSRNFCWRVSLMPGTGEIDVDNGTAADRDAAKAAAIAAARAWRDSIRL